MKTKLHFTWNTALRADIEDQSCLYIFNDMFMDFNPIEEPDRPINIVKFITLDCSQDSAWILGSTIEDSKPISIKIAKKAAARAATKISKAVSSYAVDDKRDARLHNLKKALEAIQICTSMVSTAQIATTNLIASYAAETAMLKAAQAVANAFYEKYLEAYIKERRLQKQDLLRLLEDDDNVALSDI